MSKKITYTFPVGGERFSTKACYLTKSIQTFCTSPDIVTYLLPKERETVPDVQLDFLETNTTLVEKERPIPDYPISAKLGAFVAGSEISDRDYLMHIDTDTLFLNDITIPENNTSEVYMKPVDMGFLQWGKKKSYTKWEALYEKIDIKFQAPSIQSDIDGKPIPHVYNAGVVIAENDTFPQQWLKLTRFVFNEFPDQRYSDQVALGLLYHKYNIGYLTQKHSYLMGGHYRCPSNINVIRYQNFTNLLRIPNSTIWRKLIKIGVDPFKLYSGERRAIQKMIGQVIRIPFFKNRKLRRIFGIPFSPYEDVYEDIS